MIVFPMAGLSSRFTKAGYDRPKYMLPLGQSTMFAEAVSGFSALYESEAFLFICRNIADTEAFIHAELARMPERPRSYQVVVLDAPTSGQAETVYEGLRRAGVSDNTRLTIFNIDSHRKQFAYPKGFDIEQVDGYLEVFYGDGDHWSFVRPDDTAPGTFKAAAVTEKVRISDLCSTGLYYFRRTALFRCFYEQTLTVEASELQGGERYIAPLYNMALKEGCDIRYDLISRGDISFTGTPDEYEALADWGGRSRRSQT